MHNTVLVGIWWNILITFSKQIANILDHMAIYSVYHLLLANTFAKDEIKTLSNNWDGAFSASHYWLQRQTQNLAKHQQILIAFIFVNTIHYTHTP